MLRTTIGEIEFGEFVEESAQGLRFAREGQAEGHRIDRAGHPGAYRSADSGIRPP